MSSGCFIQMKATTRPSAEKAEEEFVPLERLASTSARPDPSVIRNGPPVEGGNDAAREPSALASKLPRHPLRINGLLSKGERAARSQRLTTPDASTETSREPPGSKTAPTTGASWPNQRPRCQVGAGRSARVDVEQPDQSVDWHGQLEASILVDRNARRRPAGVVGEPQRLLRSAIGRVDDKDPNTRIVVADQDL